MPGPLPKDPGFRRRANRRAGTRVLPAEGRREAPPLLGRRPAGGAWLESTRAWWATIWASPMATQWLDADKEPLLRLAWMRDELEGGRATAALMREMRVLEDAFGLTPYGRRRLDWWVAENPPSDAGKTRTPRLRAVDPTENRNGGSTEAA